MKILNADFVTSAVRADDIPRDDLARIALVGRSNVGKSSLINALARAKIARTSAAPGKTRLVNFYRVTIDGRVRVFGTRDAGATWDPLSDGLPQDDAYLTILRQAFDHEGSGTEMGLYFGATSGDVFGSADGGASWFTVRDRLAPVNSVRVA